MEGVLRHLQHASVRGAQEIPPKLAVFGLWLGFFGSAFVGYLFSAPLLYEYYAFHTPLVWPRHIALAAVEPQGQLWQEAVRIFLNNAAIFTSFFWIALRWPRLAFYGLLVLSVKTGLMAAPYGEITFNALRYTLVMIAVALVEFWGYAQAPLRRWGPGIGALFAGALVEALLVRYGV